MSLTSEYVKDLIANFEGQTFDCKSIDILSHADDLARLMVAFGNNKFVSEDFGGRIIIGVDDNHNIENFQAKQGHEEAIMNVARDKCNPSIRPVFEKVNVDDKFVYVITIPKMVNTPCQLITREGKTFRIRVGSTIREPTHNELESLFSNSDSLKKDRTSILKSFSSNTEPTRHITIIPMDLNSKIIDFDSDNVAFLRHTQPRYSFTTQTKVVQNEFHYDGKNIPPHTYGVINELGVYSLSENIDSHRKLIHSGREIVFLFDILHTIEKIYHHFGYNQRINIIYQHTRVEGFQLGTEDAFEQINWQTFIAQKSDITIERIVSLSSLNHKALISSIFEELIRACNGAIPKGYFDDYIEQLFTKFPT